MNVLYFGIYDPEYARNKVLMSGLRANGVEVIECRESPKTPWKYLKLVAQYWKLRRKFDVMIVAFPGQEVMFLARLLTLKPIVFDAFTSHYGGYIIDHGHFPKKSWRAVYYWFLDSWSCRLARLVLLDTNAHIDFFVNEFHLPRTIFRRIWIGADDSVFYPAAEAPMVEEHDPFRVLFFGSFIPLQGASYIVQAAKMVEHERVSFRFIGKGNRPMSALADTLGIHNATFEYMLPHHELKQVIEQSDVCLGIFGDTPKTQLVIPNKVYESIAMRKPVITADTPAIRELFDEHAMLFIPTADASALAQGIMRLKQDPELRARIARAGYQTFRQRACPKVLGDELVRILREVI